MPKLLGGVGLSRMTLCNKAVMSKLAWKFVTQPLLPWVQILRQKYHRGSHLLEVYKKPGDSHIWWGLIEGLDVVRHGVTVRLGDGRNTRVRCGY